jgi:signal transduction histidine kinase
MKKMKLDEIMKAVENDIERISGNAFDMKVRKKDGRDVNVAVTFSTYESNGRFYSAFFIRDVTEKVRLEQELKNTLQKVKDANDELQNFVYVISHDLREPLRNY